MELKSQDSQQQLVLAKKLLKTVRHAAYSTVNEDGTPHNSPLMLIYNEDLTKLYVGSYSESRHCKNLLRTGQAFVVIFDSFTAGQGGIYITGINGHECVADELVEAMRVHNGVRAKQGRRPLSDSYYQKTKPSQRMYVLDVAKIQIYSVVRGEDGHIASEARISVVAKDLIEPGYNQISLKT